MKVDLIDVMGSDLSVVNAARVSFNKESEWEYEEQWGRDDQGSFYELKNKLSGKDVKLINYLAKHKHRSPFNHCFLSFRVKAPIFVARQLQKHEYLTWNEVSRRYVDEDPEFFDPKVWRGRAKDKKQGSTDIDVSSCPVSPIYLPGDDYITTPEVKDVYGEFSYFALEVYKKFLEAGVAPEQARMVLPQSMYTEWVWSGSLGAFCKMVNLRLDPHSQQETQEITRMIAGHVDFHFPVSYEALREHPIL